MPQLNDILAILSHRPHKQKTIEKLEEMFKANAEKGGNLTELVWELGFRRTKRAKQLYRRALKIHTARGRGPTTTGALKVGDRLPLRRLSIWISVRDGFYAAHLRGYPFRYAAVFLARTAL